MEFHREPKKTRVKKEQSKNQHRNTHNGLKARISCHAAQISLSMPYPDLAAWRLRFHEFRTRTFRYLLQHECCDVNFVARLQNAYDATPAAWVNRTWKESLVLRALLPLVEDTPVDLLKQDRMYHHFQAVVQANQWHKVDCVYSRARSLLQEHVLRAQQRRLRQRENLEPGETEDSHGTTKAVAWVWWYVAAFLVCGGTVWLWKKQKGFLSPAFLSSTF